MANVALGVTAPGSMGETEILSISSNTLTTLGNHGLLAGDYVVISGRSASLTAAGLSGAYYVIATGLLSAAFQVSATFNGSAATLTNRSAAKLWVKASILRRGTNLAATLASGIDASTTTIALTTGHGARLPAVPFVLIIEGPRTAEPLERCERVLVTVKSTDTLTVTRGYEGTTATAHTSSGTLRQAWVRSLAPTACSFAGMDWREQSIRDALATGALAPGVDPSTDDATTTIKGFVARANSLRTVTGTTTTLTTGAAHGMVAGDRFCFMAKVGGSNVRMGHTYHVVTAGTATTLTFAEERHGASYTTSISLATDISSGYIRVLTQSAVQLFHHRTTQYPLLWAWMTAWDGGHEFDRGSFDMTPMTAALHYDPVTFRGAQSVLHMLSAVGGWEPAANKHIGQSLEFHKDVSGGTFTLTVDALTTADITWSTTFATLKTRVKTALEALGLTSVRVFNRNKFNGSTLLSYGLFITYANSRTGITGTNLASLTGSTVGVRGGSMMLVRPDRRTQFTTRLAKVGAEILAAGNDKAGAKARVIIRLDYEFDNRRMPWGAYPSDRGFDGQQLAFDAGTTTALWRSKWVSVVDAIKTTGGATNARFWWCVMVSVTPSNFKAAYPSARPPDYVGFDFYATSPDSPATMIGKLNRHLRGMRTAVPGGTIVIGEFGHHTSGEVTDPGLVSAINDPENAGETIDLGTELLLTGESEVGLTSLSVTTRAPWFNALVQHLYKQSDVAGVLYYDLNMKERTNGAQSRGNWSLDGSPSLVSAFAVRTITPKNRRQL